MRLNAHGNVSFITLKIKATVFIVISDLSGRIRVSADENLTLSMAPLMSHVGYDKIVDIVCLCSLTLMQTVMMSSPKLRIDDPVSCGDVRDNLMNMPGRYCRCR